MKPGIHPKYQEITVTCSCGTKWNVGSTLEKDLAVEVCSNCHSFYTGKQKIAKAGAVERFRQRYAEKPVTVVPEAKKPAPVAAKKSAAAVQKQKLLTAVLEKKIPAAAGVKKVPGAARKEGAAKASSAKVPAKKTTAPVVKITKTGAVARKGAGKAKSGSKR